MDEDKNIIKSPYYSLEELKKNPDVLRRGLEDLGIASSGSRLAEFYAEWDEMSDGDEAAQEEELRMRWADPRAKTILEKALNGEDCDKISGSFGDFGTSPANPIPVNGPIGERKYLNRLRFNGQRLIYHRIGPWEVEKLPGLIVDEFEVVTMDGKHWDSLYFDYYHPRRSKMVPNRYTYSHDTGLKFLELMTNLCTIGTTSKVETFPFKMEDQITAANGRGLGEIALNLYKAAIKNEDNFKRPE